MTFARCRPLAVLFGGSPARRPRHPRLRRSGPARRVARGAAALALLCAAASASAINGYFPPGYGAKHMGVAGVGVAMPQDRLTASVNPAGMALVEPGLDVSALFIHPQREAALDCRGLGFCDRVVSDRSNRELFVVPGFGYSRRWGEHTTVGVSTYANGGMNTSYGRDLYGETAQRIAGRQPGDPGFPTRGKLGIDFAQFIIAPSAARRLGARWTVGIAPMLLIQKFSVRGLAGFGALSADPTSLSNRGSDYALGAGVRVGVIHHLRPDVRLGAQYSSPIFVQRHTKYAGLFVDGGRLDTPAHFTLGVSWDATPKLTLGFDYQRILYGQVDTIGNHGPSASELAGAIAPERRLGGANGMGFGWRDLSVYKIGAVYAYSDRLTLRAGWNHDSRLVPEDQVLLAPLVPSPMRHDGTVGFSFRFAGGDEISFAYMHAFHDTLEARQTVFFGVPVEVKGAGDAFNFGFSRDF